MKLHALIPAAILLLSPAYGADEQIQTKPISMVFSGVDVAQVLKVISIRTGASIVYSGKEAIPVTLNVTVRSAEEAVRSAASSAGLVYRKSGTVYIVASSEAMRQAVRPYSRTSAMDLPVGEAAKISSALQTAVPDASVRALGNRLLVSGLESDLREAKLYVDDYLIRLEENRVVADSVSLVHGIPADVAKVVSAVFPEVKTVPAEGKEPGVLAYSGPKRDMVSVRDLISKLDVPRKSTLDPVIFKVYRLKYASSNSVADFLKKASPEVEAIVGPDTISPPAGNFLPILGPSGFGGNAQGGQSNFGQSNSQQPAGQGGQLGATGQRDGTLDFVPKDGDRARTVVLKGPQSLVEAAVKLIESIDIKPIQVMVEASVLEVSPKFSENLGIDWNLNNNQTVREQNFGASGIGFGRFTRVTPAQFSAILNARIESRDAKVLANPKVQATDNDSAFIFIGNTVRARIVTSGALGVQNVQIQEFPIGIILRIRPRVNSDGNITMNLNPIVSTITSISAENIPQTASREAQTTSIIKDGETIVIGGLISEEFSRTTSAVPILSKIPIIGELFKNRNSERKKTELIVTITPRIIKD